MKATKRTKEIRYVAMAGTPTLIANLPLHRANLYAAPSGLTDSFRMKRRVPQHRLLHPALISVGLSGLGAIRTSHRNPAFKGCLRHFANLPRRAQKGETSRIIVIRLKEDVTRLRVKENTVLELLPLTDDIKKSIFGVK